MKKFIAALIVLSAGLFACDREADIASRNLAIAADEFQVTRRIVFYNGITDSYMLTIEGLCSLDPTDKAKLVVTCTVGPTSYKKHYLGLSDNVTYFVEHIDSTDVSGKHYKVLFKPTQIIPDVEVK